MNRICERGAGNKASYQDPSASQVPSDSLVHCLAASFMIPQGISCAGRMVQTGRVSNQLTECATMCISSNGGALNPMNTCIAPLGSSIFSLDPPVLTPFDTRSSGLQIQLDSAAPPRLQSMAHAADVVSSGIQAITPLRDLASSNATQHFMHPVTAEDPLLRYLCANQSPSTSTPAPTPTSGSSKRKDDSKRSFVDTMKPPKKRSRRNSDGSTESNTPSYRPYQEEQWAVQFQELLDFKARHGHCRIPNASKNNSSLSRWVKRQRYQYKLKQEKKSSALSDERVQQLEEVGFVWDYHGVVWEERRADLDQFKRDNGDCNVPSHYPKNPKLSAWVKCQRRQYKRFINGHSSSMTVDRFAALDKMGFTWKVRGSKDGESSLDDLDLM